MNVYGLYKKTDPSMCTVYGKHCLQDVSKNTQLSMFFLNKIKFLGSQAVVLVKTFPFMNQLLLIGMILTKLR